MFSLPHACENIIIIIIIIIIIVDTAVLRNVQTVPGGHQVSNSFAKVKRSGREINHSVPFSAMVKNVCVAVPLMVKNVCVAVPLVCV